MLNKRLKSCQECISTSRRLSNLPDVHRLGLTQHLGQDKGQNNQNGEKGGSENDDFAQVLPNVGHIARGARGAAGIVGVLTGRGADVVAVDNELGTRGAATSRRPSSRRMRRVFLAIDGTP